MSFHPSVAAVMRRPDLVRAGGVEGRGGTTAAGQGRVYGAGATAAGLSAEARLGTGAANFTLDTGTISSLMIAGIVIGFVAFYMWTRSSQA